jgi:hypothetical protein
MTNVTRHTSSHRHRMNVRQRRNGPIATLLYWSTYAIIALLVLTFMSALITGVVQAIVNS